MREPLQPSTLRRFPTAAARAVYTLLHRTSRPDQWVWYIFLPSKKQQRRALTLFTSQVEIKILHALMQSPKFRTFI